MKINNIIMGKVITRTFELASERNSADLLMYKPYLKWSDEIKWEEITSFWGTNIRSNNNNCYGLNLDGNEENDIIIFREIFNVSSGEMVLYSTKEIKVSEINKEDIELQLSDLVKEYNKQEIGKDEKLLNYCNVHKLSVEDTDVNELRKIIYDNKALSYSWFSGTIRANNLPMVIL